MALTSAKIAEIAERYGFRPTERIVVELVAQAESYHGMAAMRLNGGEPIVSWGTDSRGVYQADKLLNGYLSETAACAFADAASHRDFCRDAYGEGV